jgi:hypothetical protein
VLRAVRTNHAEYNNTGRTRDTALRHSITGKPAARFAVCLFIFIDTSALMSRRLLVTMAVTGLALLVAAGGYWWTRRVMVFSDSAWPVPAVSSLARISMISGGTPFDLISGDGRWVVQDPQTGMMCLADSARVNRLVDTVRQNRPVQHLGAFEPSAAAAYGLDKNLTGLTFYGRRQWSIHVGAEGWRKHTVYARATQEGDDMYLLDSVYRDMLSAEAASYCDMGLVGVSAAQVVRLAVEGPGIGAWEVARTASGFAFSGQLAGTDAQVSSQAVDFYLHVLTGMRASGLTETAPEDLPPPQLRISVWRQGAARPEEVLIYHTGNGGSSFLCQASRQPGFVLLEDDRVDKLSRSAFDMSERPVLSRPLNGVEGQKITLRRDGVETTFLLGRKEQGWRDLVTGGTVLGLDVITYGLGSLQYEFPPQDTPPEQAVPWLVWELYGEGGAAALALYFYKDPALPAGFCRVRVDDTGPWFTVGTRLVDDMLSRVPAPAPDPVMPQTEPPSAPSSAAANATEQANGQ